MEDDAHDDAARRAKAALIDTTAPNAARVIDYFNGGLNNFAADRKAGRALLSVAPVIAEIGPALHAFQHRMVRFLVQEAGIRQFLDIGTGLPVVGNTHEVAQFLVPQCRVVYADDDPMVLSHARALLRSAPGGAVGYVDADVRDPALVVDGARATLDFSKPVAILLLLTLGYVTDTAVAAAIVSSLAAAVPAGSYVAIGHLASGVDCGLDEAQSLWNRLMPRQPITARPPGEVAAITAGLEPVPPGLVPATAWRPEADDPVATRPIPVHGIVARTGRGG